MRQKIQMTSATDSPVKGKSIFEYNKRCNGAIDYMSFAKEVLKLKLYEQK